jgi:deazaflavin-dependent oxidoreductase (nitroreductase family)
MAKTYKVTPFIRLINRFMRIMIRLGIAPRGTVLLTVKGRKTGKLYSTPVLLVEEGSERWLVSPYGEVNWVRNARAAGQVTLSTRGGSETVSIVELGPEESAPILKTYITQEAIVRPYFDVASNAPLEAFEAEAPRHPVFHIS